MPGTCPGIHAVQRRKFCKERRRFALLEPEQLNGVDARTSVGHDDVRVEVKDGWYKRANVPYRLIDAFFHLRHLRHLRINLDRCHEIQPTVSPPR